MKLFLLVLVAASVVFAMGCVEDQAQDTYGTSDVPVIGGATNQLVAQTITAGVEGGLVSVKVPVFCINFPANVTLEIRSTASNKPTDTVLGSKTINIDVGTISAPPLVEYKLDDPIYFAQGSLYAIVLTSPGRCAVASGPDGDSYAGGNSWVKNNQSSGAWGCFCSSPADPPPPWDLVFETTVNTHTRNPSATFAATGTLSEPSTPVCTTPNCGATMTQLPH